jgi:hypothetical protein
MRDTNAESTESIDRWVARDKQETTKAPADEIVGMVAVKIFYPPT